MIQNYIRSVLRGIRREKGFAVINVCGLAIGLACCLLIMLYVHDELSYDRQHPDVDRLYRITNHVSTAGDERHMAITPSIYAPSLMASDPSVEAFLRIHPAMETMVFRSEETRFIEEDIIYADSSFFELLGFELAEGDPRHALAAPYSLVLTPRLAARYFGQDSPLGQTLRVNERDDYTVTGVFAEEPRQSHLHFAALMSYVTLEGMHDVWAYGSDNAFLNSWHMAAGYSFVKLAPEAAPEDAAESMSGLVIDNVETGGPSYRPELQPVPDIHLRSDLLYELGPNSSIVYVWVFGIVALFMLGIACINYVNLATARSIKRGREVGVRKALGANRRQLIYQFLSESIIMVGVAVVVAFTIAILSLPLFNEMAGKDLSATTLIEPSLLIAFLVVTAVAGLVAGSYPAFVLSRLHPAGVLKNLRTHAGGSALLRQGLVVFQFAAAIALLIGTSTVYEQLAYVQSRDLGFDQKHVVTYELPDGITPERLETMKAILAEHAGIVSVGASSDLPTRTTSRHNTWPEGQPDQEPRLMSFYGVDHDFVETLGFEITEGRTFSRAFPSDSTDAYLLNEAAVRRLGWEGTAIGRDFTWSRPGVGMHTGQVIGVVKDFHYESLRVAIEPAFFALTPDRAEVVAVRMRPDQLQSGLTHMEHVAGDFFPDYPFAYDLLDERLEAVYAGEQRFGWVFGVFTLLTILVACLGLFGLAAFTAQQRTKEIGVRKVLGATVLSILALLTKDFLKLVCLGFLIGVPVAYLAMNRWLEDFAYRIDIGPGVFVLAGVLALAIALLTVSYQAIRAALSDPVKSLRYE